MEINKKIDLQVASLKTVLESLKLETIRYLAGGLVWGCGSDCPMMNPKAFAPPQRLCSPAWPSLWGSTDCGGEGAPAERPGSCCTSFYKSVNVLLHIKGNLCAFLLISELLLK